MHTAIMYNFSHLHRLFNNLTMEHKYFSCQIVQYEEKKRVHAEATCQRTSKPDGESKAIFKYFFIKFNFNLIFELRFLLNQTSFSDT